MINILSLLPDIPKRIDGSFGVPHLNLLRLMKHKQCLHSFSSNIRHWGIMDQWHQAINELKRGTLDLMTCFALILWRNNRLKCLAREVISQGINSPRYRTSLPLLHKATIIQVHILHHYTKLTFSISIGSAWIRRTIHSSRFLYDGASSEDFSLNFRGITFSFSVRLWKNEESSIR